MKIDKKELKKISYDFRSLGGRIIHANCNEVASIIAMFIAYIERTPLLLDYINSLPKTTSVEQIENDLNEASASFGKKMLSTGASPEEEVLYVYTLLKILISHQDQIYALGFGYCHSNNFQDMTKAFGNNIVLPFVNNVLGYLVHIGIDIGMDETNTFNITVNGGQFNLSQDNSTLSAVQNNNGIDLTKIQEMIADILKVASQNTIGSDQQQQIADALICIQEELKKQSPKKGAITMLLNGLKSTANVLASIPEISQKINSFAEYIAPFIS